MTNIPNDLPLWRVMLDAYCEHPRYADDYLPQERHGMVLEIRALADIIERRGEQGLDLDPGETADWLRAEAAIAEAGS